MALALGCIWCLTAWGYCLLACSIVLLAGQAYLMVCLEVEELMVQRLVLLYGCYR
jgi:hypothetical protein